MILIDMDFPKVCGQCCLLDEEMFGCIVGSNGVVNRYHLNPNEKPEWCPIYDMQNYVHVHKKELEYMEKDIQLLEEIVNKLSASSCQKEVNAFDNK